MSLNRDAILSADDLPRKSVDVPEWGGSVWVKTMTAGERDAWEADCLNRQKANNDTTDLTNFRARYCVLVLVDDDGNRMFTNAEAVELGNKSAPAVDRIFDAARKLNKISDDDIDELEKNSEAAQSDASASG